MSQELPQKSKRKWWVNWLPILGFLILLFWQAILTSESKKLDAAPVHYSQDWEPLSRTYYPGDMARFRVTLEADYVPISCLRIESLHSLKRDESHPAVIVYKEITREGKRSHVNSFKIAEDIPPGWYILQGMLIPYGKRGLEVAPFVSKPFQIVGRSTHDTRNKGAQKAP